MPIEGGQQGFFEFGTNIAAIREQIVSNLNAMAGDIQAATARLGEGVVNPNFLASFNEQITALGTEGVAKVQAAAAAMRDAMRSAYESGGGVAAYKGALPSGLGIGTITSSTLANLRVQMERVFREAPGGAIAAGLGPNLEAQFKTVAAQYRTLVSGLHGDLARMSKQAGLPVTETVGRGAGLAGFDAAVATWVAELRAEFEASAGAVSAVLNTFTANLRTALEAGSINALAPRDRKTLEDALRGVGPAAGLVSPRPDGGFDVKGLAGGVTELPGAGTTAAVTEQATVAATAASQAATKVADQRVEEQISKLVKIFGPGSESAARQIFAPVSEGGGIVAGGNALLGEDLVARAQKEALHGQVDTLIGQLETQKATPGAGTPAQTLSKFIEEHAATENLAAKSAAKLSASEEEAARLTTLAGEIRAKSATLVSSGVYKSPSLGLVDSKGRPLTDVRLAEAEHAATVAGVGPTKQGVGSAFGGGFFGRGYNPGSAFNPDTALGNLVGTVGVLARYGAAGVAIAGLFKGISEVKTQYLDFGRALANLQGIESGLQGQTIDLNSAIQAGVPAGLGAADAVNTAADALARYGEQIRNGADASEVATETVRNVGQAMILTGQDAATAAGQLFDATQGFDVGFAGQSRILDAVENARRQYGGNRSEILTAVADSADLAREAGVDPEQLANIFALIQARTQASATSVASAFERTISRSGTGQFRTALNQLGVRPSGNIVTDITAVSAAYQHLDAVQKQQLIASLGGARQARELLPLLQEGKNLLDSTANSYRGAGAAAEQAARDQASMAGQLRQVRGALRDIALQGANSGLLAPLGLAIETLRPALQGLDELLRLVNKLPVALRAVAFTAVEAVAAIRLLGSPALKAVTAETLAGVPVLSRVIGPQPAVAEVAAANAAATAAEADVTAAAASDAAATKVAAAKTAAEIDLEAAQEEAAIRVESAKVAAAETTTASAIAGVTGPLGRGAGANLLVAGLGRALISPISLAIIALVAIGGVKDVFDKLHTAAAAGAVGLQELSQARSVDDYRTAQDQIANARVGTEKAVSGHLLSLSGFFQNLSLIGDYAVHGGHSTIADQHNKLVSEENYANAEAARLAASQQSTLGPLASFGPTGRDISLGLGQMAQRGIDANTQLRAVATALGLVKTNSQGLAGELTSHPVVPPSGLLGNEAGVAALTGIATGAAPGIGHTGGAFGIHGLPGFATSETGAAAPPSQSVHDAIQKELDRAGIKPGQLIPKDVQKHIVTQVLALYDFKGDAADVAETRKQVRHKLLKGIADLSKANTEVLKGDDLKTLLQGDGKDNPGLAAIIQGISPNPKGVGGGVGQLSLAVRTLQDTANRADKNDVLFPTLIRLLDDTEVKLVKAKLDASTRLRHALQAKAGSKSAIAAIGQRFLKQDVDTALKYGDVNDLIGILDAANQAEILIVKHELENVAEEAKHAYELALARDALFSNNVLGPRSPDLGPLVPGSGSLRAKQAMDAANKKYKEFLKALGLTTAPKKGGDYATGGDAGSAATDAIDTAHQTHIAYLESLAVPGDQLSEAANAVRVAEYQLSIAKKNSADYWSAVKALNEAKYQYAQAEISQSNTKELLRIDITNPVKTAKAAVDDATRKLNYDKRRGAHTAGDRLTLKQAQADYEKQLFEQQFQDAQTNYDLGRTSYSAYLRYLQSQHDYLVSVKHKTRAQKEELDEVDKAMKSLTDSLQGQFNLGDIKVPTPYEARRSALGGGTGHTSVVNTTNHVAVTVNDANLEKVDRLFKKYFGTATRRTTTSYRKG